MENVKVSHAEALKAELMERYGLREDQVRLEIGIHTTDLELGRTILKDFGYEGVSKEFYLPEGKKCDYVTGKDINQVWIHRRDGFYGSYEGENDDE